MDSNGNGADKTLVYLVRHGLTDWNSVGRYQGQTDIPLNVIGLSQAEAASEWLAQQPVVFSTVYTSDLKRASQTAQVIGGKLGLSPIPEATLREISCGHWEGLTRAEIAAQFPEEQARWQANRYSYSMPGGENIPAVQARLSAFYWEVVERHRGDTVIIVTHGMALLALAAALRGVHIAEYWRSKIFIGNTSVTIVSFANGVPNIELFNSVAHLPE